MLGCCSRLTGAGPAGDRQRGRCLNGAAPFHYPADMADDAAALESGALRRSMLATAVLGLLGVGWGVVSGSQAILLDGAYGVIGIAVTWLLMQAGRIAREVPSRAYPFGRQSITPLAVAIQGCVLLATLAYAVYEAVLTIGHGGSDVTPGPAVLYSAIATASSVAVWSWLRPRAARSELVASEAVAWRLSAARGVAMVAGFTLLLGVTGSSLAWIGPYIDPVLVLLSCLFLVVSPLEMVRDTVRELLEAGPSAEVRESAQVSAGEVLARHGVADPDIRLAKVGGKLYVQIMGRAAPATTIEREHTIRIEAEQALAGLPYEVWLTLELVPSDAPPDDSWHPA